MVGGGDSRAIHARRLSRHAPLAGRGQRRVLVDERGMVVWLAAGFGYDGGGWVLGRLVLADEGDGCLIGGGFGYDGGGWALGRLILADEGGMVGGGFWV